MVRGKPERGRLGVAVFLLTVLGAGVVACAPAVAPAPYPPGGVPIPSVLPGGDQELPARFSRQEEENAMLRGRIAEQNDEVDVLRQEVERLKLRETEMELTVARLTASAGTGAVPPPTAPESVSATAQQQLTALQEQLDDERRARAMVEGELARLKEETSTAPLTRQPAESEGLAAARKEVDDLRQQLAKETAERERLADQLSTLQSASRSPAEPGQSDTELRRQLAELQTRRDELVASANRDLAVGREREAELETKLAAAQDELEMLRARASQVAVPVETLQQTQLENAALRAAVERARKENEALSLKLRTAQRVAELIFKMRAGNVESVPPPER